MMKYLYTFLTTVFALGIASAQKIDFKNEVISVDGKEIAKVNKIKDRENFGFTSTYELYSMSGKKLVIAAYASEYDHDHTTNMSFYYRLTFLTTDQVGIFSLSKLGGEKSFAKLIGASGIIVNDELDAAKVKDFIAMKGKDPSITVRADDYLVASRQRGWPVKLNTDKTIEQDHVQIGSFKDVTGADGDTYEISLPNGIVAVRLSFTGGNNTQAFDVITMKDRARRTIKIPTRDKVMLSSTDVDRNQIALARIINWLVNNGYL